MNHIPNTQQDPAGEEEGNRPLLEVEGLTKLFPVSKNLFRKATSFIHGVDGVAFNVSRGESLGVVGESGCGKTTIGKLLVKLLDPDAGRVRFLFPSQLSEDAEPEHVDISALRGSEIRGFRRNAQMIFQDPYESMNPRRTIYDIISESHCQFKESATSSTV